MKEENPNQRILYDKKDIESWLHQADPALTVQKLPMDPQISFRKTVLSKFGKNNDKKDKNVSVFIVIIDPLYWLPNNKTQIIIPNFDCLYIINFSVSRKPQTMFYLQE